LLGNYGLVAIFLIVAILFAITTVILPSTLRFLGIVPQRPNRIKTSTYECGVQTYGKTWVQFNFRYYYYALVFVAIDVMAVFIYPWAVQFRQLGISAFAAIIILSAFIVVGYLYAWRKGVLEWK